MNVEVEQRAPLVAARMIPASVPSNLQMPEMPDFWYTTAKVHTRGTFAYASTSRFLTGGLSSNVRTMQ
eukprot:5760497-Prorocentrum_lima.AAC.1